MKFPEAIASYCADSAGTTVNKVEIRRAKTNRELTATPLPLFGSKVAAGFPSPADDYRENSLDLNQYLIKKPSATFMARAQGNSMIRLGIFDGDLLIIDRSIEPSHGQVVIAALNGDLVCKVLDKHQQQLLSANDQYPPIAINEEMALLIEGVVTYSIRSHCGNLSGYR